MDDAINPQVSGEAGGADLPSPTFSDNATSSPSVDADVLVSKLLAQLKPEVEKMVQSTKDKRISKIEKELEGRSRLLAELEEKGVQIPNDVRLEMRLREIEDRQNGSSSQPAKTPDAGPSGSKAAVTEAIATLQKYGQDPNDPAFIELCRGRYANTDAFQAAVYAHVIGKLAQPKPASPAGVVQAPATGGIPAQNVEALTQEYKTKMRGARGNKSQLSAIREEYQQKGVKVWEVDFS